MDDRARNMDYQVSPRRRPLPPAMVRTAGEIRNQPYHSTPGTKQGDVMLILILAGYGFYEDAERLTYVEPGMVGLIPDVRPGILFADRDRPYHKAYCRFRGDYASSLAMDILGERRERFFHAESALRIGELVRRMGHIHRASLPVVLTADAVLLLETLRVLSGDRSPESARLDGHGIRSYLSERVSQATDLDEMARYFAVSRSTLCRTVRRETGSTVQRLHRELKIGWAKQLLGSPRMSVSEVAYRAGFSDPYYFSRVFRLETGHSPRGWRMRSRR